MHAENGHDASEHEACQDPQTTSGLATSGSGLRSKWELPKQESGVNGGVASCTVPLLFSAPSARTSTRAVPTTLACFLPQYLRMFDA